MISLYTKNIEGVWFGVACEEGEIFATAFASSEQRTVRSLLKSIPFNVNFRHRDKTSALAGRVIALLKDVYDGKEVSHGFSLVKGYLSSYAGRVIDVVSLIPVGYVASYGSVATAAGGSPRAVGRVMSMNPFPLIIPCHRVVRSDFSPGGYGGGVDVKLGILKRESRGHTSEREISVDDKKLLVSPVEKVMKRVGKDKD